MKLGLIARSDNTGLGNQTRNLAYMLRPEKIMLIDSTIFNQNEQHPEWYDGFNVQTINGFPNGQEIVEFLNGLTHMITCETEYNRTFFSLAQRHNVKTYSQINYEFCDYFLHPNLTLPNKILMPSYWKLEEMQERFNAIYLPPPIDISHFKDVTYRNFNRESVEKRFLHIVGKEASKDRNGTRDLINSLQYSKEHFELVIRSQYPIDIQIDDPRVRLDIRDYKEQSELYMDCDVMILPRRYGGLCLPMNEALASGLPVIMPNISPNNQILPSNWLIEAQVTDTLKARMELDVYSSDLVQLGQTLDNIARMNPKELGYWKAEAYDIAINNYSFDTLRPQYMELFS